MLALSRSVSTSFLPHRRARVLRRLHRHAVVVRRSRRVRALPGPDGFGKALAQDVLSFLAGHGGRIGVVALCSEWASDSAGGAWWAATQSNSQWGCPPEPFDCPAGQRVRVEAPCRIGPAGGKGRRLPGGRSAGQTGQNPPRGRRWHKSTRAAPQPASGGTLA